MRRGRPSKAAINTLEKRRETFLDVLAETANVSLAAQAAGIHRRTAYVWKDKNAQFAKAWAEAEEKAADTLEEEARRRAVEGVQEPVFYQGQEVGQVRRHSDTLLIFLLKARRPEKYRERHQAELTGSMTITVQMPAGIKPEQNEQDPDDSEDDEETT